MFNKSILSFLFLAIFSLVLITYQLVLYHFFNKFLDEFISKFFEFFFQTKVSNKMACAVPQIEGQQNTSGSSGTSTIRPPRFTMEGVGARVIRGPDWKWGKQVIN